MQTLAEHLKASAEITKHIEDGDALAKKIGAKLAQARATLETLREFAPPEKFKIDLPYHLKQHDSRVTEGSMAEIIKRQVSAINEILGDRAS